MKILMTGNSFIYNGTKNNENGPAKIFEKLAKAGGHEVDITGTYIGGSILSQHWNDRNGINPRDELANGNYDLMVMGGGNHGSFGATADRFSDLAAANGTDVLFYGLWAPDWKISVSGGDTFSQNIHNQYTAAAGRNDGAYSPNGLAYREAYNVFHNKYGKGDNGENVEKFLTHDAIHASPAGAMVAAMTLYSTIFNERAPLSFRPSEVSAADARIIRDIAWDTVQKHAVKLDGSAPKAQPSKPTPQPTKQNVEKDGSVEGRIFVDDDGNNRDDGDAGLSGATVYLYNKATRGIVDRDTTDGSGKYSFDNVKAGNYEVRFADIKDRDWVKANVGSDSNDSDLSNKWSNGGGTTGNISVGSGQTVRNVDAGVTPLAKKSVAVKPTAPKKQPANTDKVDGNTLSGKVFNDANKNGVDNGEAGVAGVEVSLYMNGRGVIAKTSTKSDGSYDFDGLKTGTYTVRFDPADNAKFSRGNVGNDSNDSDVASVWGSGIGVTKSIRITNDVKDVDAGISFSGSAKAPAPVANNAGKTITGDSGSDRLRGTNNDDRIFGGNGNDDMVGGAGNDVINGGGGVDRTFAGTGDDMIIFDNSDSLYYGGHGNDTFVFNGGTSDLDMRIVSVETFDMKNNRSDLLKMGVEDVRQANGLLTIEADRGDRVELDTNQNVRKIGERSIDGEDYDLYAIGGSRAQQFLLDDDASLSIV